jgi:hypothetical protein
VLSGWSGYSACTKTCGDGIKAKSRSVIVAEAGGGKSCDARSHTMACNVFACPVNCEVHMWSDYGECSVTCGVGTRVRTRMIKTDVVNGGASCPLLSMSKSCDEGNCPIHCDVSAWTEYSECSKSCTDETGKGQKTKTRTITRVPNHGGYQCPELSETVDCNNHPCPIDCVVNAYGTWKDCSASCAGGTKYRTRTVKSSAKYGGASCPTLMATAECNNFECPKDCIVSTYNSFSTCSTSCGSGAQSRSRSVVQHASHGGVICPTLTDSQSCNNHKCPEDCDVSGYGTWSTCSTTCGKGSQDRTRRIIKHPKYGGKVCPGLSESSECFLLECPVDCKLSDWSDWSECSTTCAEGSQSKTKSITTRPKFGGKSCGLKTKRQPCNAGPCPVHCQVSEWSTYGGCSKSCNGGLHHRTRSVATHHAHGGNVCPDLKEEKDCNDHLCPEDCIIGSWGTWGTCSKTCGAGKWTRTRTLTAPKHGGKTCPTAEMSGTCNDFKCPKDCIIGAWGDWSTCSLTCGSGSQHRSRTNVAAQHGGKACPTASNKRNCNSFNCPVDCEFTKFTAWSECSDKCNGGRSARSRSVTNPAAFGGVGCPTLDEYEDCNQQCCVGYRNAAGKCTACNPG